jgi:acetate kinase
MVVDFCDHTLSTMEKGNPRAAAAIKVFAYQIRKYLGAYTAAMNGLDAIVFTGGIGEKSSLIRKMVCNGSQGLDTLGIHYLPCVLYRRLQIQMASGRLMAGIET